MQRTGFRLAPRLALAAALLALAFGTAGCKRAFEAAKCKSAAEKVCAKWF
ncbi:MAG: hypothetical protein HY744_02605 [Deltaproteobacteria bacterium]|nr:hypothetical protein [Deltaproteobacteria bacterium]